MATPGPLAASPSHEAGINSDLDLGFQLRQAYIEGGALALQNRKRGPQRNYRRTDEVVRQIIRHRFLDLDAFVAVIAQLRQRLGQPAADWDASHLAQASFQGIEGDLRVSGETILVTCYNAPHAECLRKLYEELPAKLEDEHLDPRIPWLYNFKLDFRFR